MSIKSTHARLNHSKWVKDEEDTFFQILGDKNCFKRVGRAYGSP
jgi:hypothetical protein